MERIMLPFRLMMLKNQLNKKPSTNPFWLAIMGLYEKDKSYYYCGFGIVIDVCRFRLAVLVVGIHTERRRSGYAVGDIARNRVCKIGRWF